MPNVRTMPAMYLGSSALSKVMLGGSQVWPEPSGPPGFTEEGTVINSGTYLTDTGGALGAATYKQALMFSSVITSRDSVRAALISWRGTTGALYSNIEGNNGAVGGYAPFRSDAGTTISAKDEDAALMNQRYHILASHWIDASGGGSARLVIYNADGGVLAWRTLISSDNTPGTSAFIDFRDAMRIFQRSDNTNHDFIGTSFRQAMWVGTDTGPLADISLTSVRDNFVNSSTGAMINPDTSQTAYAGKTLLFDYYTTAALNNGTPDAGTRTHS